MQRISLSEKTLNNVFAVLQQLPYQQVAGLMAEIQKDAAIVEEKKETKESDE